MPAFDATDPPITIVLPNGNFSVWDLDTGEGQGRGMVRETYSRQWQENQARWRIACAWNDRLGIVAGMLGGIIGGVYQSPKAYFANANWTCSKIECTGVGKASQDAFNGFITFPYGILDLQFGVLDFTGTSLVSEMELDFSGNSIAVDQTASTFKYADNSNVPPSAIPAYRQTTVFGSIRLYNRGSLNSSLYLNAVDTVNSTTFQGAGIKTVMFKGAKTEKMFTPVGLLQYNVTLLFELNPRGWDAILQPSTGWTTYKLQSGAYPWTTSDHNLLLA